jgi:hypothetical protein
MGQGKLLTGASAQGFAPPANTSTQQAQRAIRTAGTPTASGLIQASPGNFGTTTPVTPSGRVQTAPYPPAQVRDRMYAGAGQAAPGATPSSFTPGMDQAAAPGDLLNQGIDGVINPFGYKQ